MMGVFSFFGSFNNRSNAKKKKNYSGFGYQKRMYESASSYLIRDIFKGDDIDEVIQSQSSNIVRRAREAYANNDYVKGYISMACTNVVGHQGIRLQSKTNDSDLNKSVELAFKRWSKRGSSDVTGQLSFIDVQLACVRALLRDGEFFVVKHVIEGQLQLQLIDCKRIDVTKRATLSSGCQIINGIEFNPLGRPLAYYLLSDNSSDTQRIPADQVIHGYIHEYIGQKRGISTIATALIRLGLLKEFETAAVDNARSNAKSMGFFRKGLGEMDFTQTETKDKEFDLQTLDDSARFHVLPQGYDVDKFEGNFPNATYAPFKESILKAISSSLGYGVNYINLGNDLKGVSYSSARQGLLSEREAWKMLQTLMIDSLIRPVFESWLSLSMVNETLSMVSPFEQEDIEENIRFQPRTWAWIDPLKDAKGTTESIQNHTLSLTQAIIDAGGDPEDTLNQIAADKVMMEKLGIQAVSTSLKDGKSSNNPRQRSLAKQIAEGIENAKLLNDE